jgi:hypothetical protein
MSGCPNLLQVRFPRNAGPKALLRIQVRC